MIHVRAAHTWNCARAALTAAAAAAAATQATVGCG